MRRRQAHRRAVGHGGVDYQVGRFPRGWAEWNDRYRDDVRDFWRRRGGVRRDGLPADRLQRPLRRRPPRPGRVGELRHRARRQDAAPTS